jgi:hypothetical protein
MLIVAPQPLDDAAESSGAPPAALLGPRLGILHNGKPNTELTLTCIAELLEQSSDISIVDRDQFVARGPVPEEVIDHLANNCDWVLVGSAD